MGNFFSMFRDSAMELKKVRTLAVAGMFMAVSIVLRTIAIPIGQDIRITFSYLGIMVIAMLYGPVVTMIAALGTDLIGYILDGSKMREYNLLLAAVVLLGGLVYGTLLYRKKENIALMLSGVLARVIVIVLCNMVLNSLIIYGSYINPGFPIAAGGGDWTAFWVWITPRLIKNVGQFPFDVLVMMLILPTVSHAYAAAFGGKSGKPHQGGTDPGALGVQDMMTK